MAAAKPVTRVVGVFGNGDVKRAKTDLVVDVGVGTGA